MTKTRLVFDFDKKPHAKRMLEDAFARCNAGSVELPRTLYNPARGLKIAGISRTKRFTWLPVHEPVAQRPKFTRLQPVSAVITKKRGKFCGEMTLIWWTCGA